MKALKAGFKPNKIVFSGVGKTSEEINFAVNKKILLINAESKSEILEIERIAKKNKKNVDVGIRFNPNVDAKTHPYISTGLKENKFGVSEESAFDLYKKAKLLDSIEIEGIDCHIGSQITDLKPFEDSIKKLIKLVDRLEEEGINIRHTDIGGGIGIRYDDEKTIDFNEYAKIISSQIKERKIKILLEPGRVITADAGVILTKVEYVKKTKDKNLSFLFNSSLFCKNSIPFKLNRLSPWYTVVPVP